MMDYKLALNTIVFASYAGMRGAVALCLALLLTLNDKIPKKVSMVMLFHVCGTVVLTLGINGMTSAWLLKYLGLAKEKKIALKFMRDFFEKLHTKTLQFCAEAIADDNYLIGVNWETVKDDCKLKLATMYNKQFKIHGVLDEVEQTKIN